MWVGLRGRAGLHPSARRRPEARGHQEVQQQGDAHDGLVHGGPGGAAARGESPPGVRDQLGPPQGQGGVLCAFQLTSSFNYMLVRSFEWSAPVYVGLLRLTLCYCSRRMGAELFLR